jgi:hypothetical protein
LQVWQWAGVSGFAVSVVRPLGHATGGAALAGAGPGPAGELSGCVAIGARGRALLDTRYARAAAHAAWTRLLAEVADDGAASR